MKDVILFGSVFLACLVEGVEALTIVLAVGTTRGWRSTMYGVSSALVVLTGFVAALGPAVSAIPLNALRLVVGALLLIFGLQWLRKAILRASGFKALHDEDAIFDREAALAVTAPAERVRRVEDWYAFTVAFKGVLLEGLEVAFIVVTFGSNQGSLTLGILGAVAAILVVLALGLLLRKPLVAVPENTLKFVVGVMLTSFGIFWAAEGAGARWPGDDVAILGIVAVTALVAFAQVAWLRSIHARQAIAS